MKSISVLMQIALFAMISCSDVAEVKDINYDKKIQVAAQYEINKDQNNMDRMLVDPGTM